uniref:non-specific serine/threonine protein kinase n=1 Tax=Lactuca sativa TaxID=4236 RepID=A0A9R1XHY6_LACSA|nr:hypothetical protein LSAT_V11C400212270 [Lactuca sativa]
MERYEELKHIGSGNFGVAKLVKHKQSGELYAVKYIERGPKIDEHVEREILNHRSLTHPHIIRFKEVLLTETHLAIVMEYAAGGELFDRITTAGIKLMESSGKVFLPTTNIRRELLPFNVFHSQPKSTVGTPAYIAPEVLSRKEYDGKMADVWSCGVTLYVMLVGAYPFEDEDDPKNFRKTLTRILSVQYSIPDYVRVSEDCKHLLSRIFVGSPDKRITIPEIQKHPWFLKELPVELIDGDESILDMDKETHVLQSIKEVKEIVQEARRCTLGTKDKERNMDLEDDIDTDAEIDDDIETSGDFVCAL